MKYCHSRKGQNLIVNSILALVVIFIFGLVSMVVFKSYNDLAPDIKDDITSVEGEKVVDDINNKYPKIFDAAIVFVFLGFWALLVVSSFVSEEYPLLFGFMLILQVFVIIASMLLGNVYEELFADASLSGVTAKFSLANYLLSHYLQISIVFTVTAILIAFGKNRF